jgi:hypothetical protein
VCTSVNERSVVTVVFLSPMLKKILFNKHDVYHFGFLL